VLGIGAMGKQYFVRVHRLLLNQVAGSLGFRIESQSQAKSLSSGLESVSWILSADGRFTNKKLQAP
jgi:hypothetical protein